MNTVDEALEYLRRVELAPITYRAIILTMAALNDAENARDDALAEVERLQVIEARIKDAALNDPGPRGLWAAQMIAIRKEA